MDKTDERQQVAKYLKTLRRVPGDVILSIASRDIDPLWAPTCLCGWVVREHLATIADKDAGEVNATGDSAYEAQEIYGGTDEEWEAIYRDIWDDEQHAWHHGGTGKRAALVEEAFTLRVMEAAGIR